MGFCLFGGPGLLKAPATSEIQGPFASTTAKEAKTHSELTHTLSKMAEIRLSVCPSARQSPLKSVRWDKL
jgi:hypothetical protein